MSSEINIQQDGKDEQRRAAPTSPRYAAALVAAMLAASAPMPVLSQGVQLVVVDVHAVADGYRASKLIGSTVVNDQNEKVGTIEDIMSTGAHDVWVVRDGEREVLVPVISDVVKAMDLAARRVTIEAVPGLLD